MIDIKMRLKKAGKCRVGFSTAHFGVCVVKGIYQDAQEQYKRVVGNAEQISWIDLSCNEA